MDLYLGGLIIARTFASEIWRAYFQEGYFFLAGGEGAYYWNFYGIVQFQKISILPPRKIIFVLHPPPPGNSSLSSYIASPPRKFLWPSMGWVWIFSGTIHLKAVGFTWRIMRLSGKGTLSGWKPAGGGGLNQWGMFESSSREEGVESYIYLPTFLSQMHEIVADLLSISKHCWRYFLKRFLLFPDVTEDLPTPEHCWRLLKMLWWLSNIAEGVTVPEHEWVSSDSLTMSNVLMKQMQVTTVN